MAPVKDLEEASPPKLGGVTIGFDSIDAIAPLFSKYFDTEWTETDPAGFGSRAVVGKHRVKLVEKPDPALSDHFMQSLIAAEMMRSEEHTSELQSLMRISYAVFCLKKKKKNLTKHKT